MNWRQLYNSLTPEERLELLLLMFRKIEARRAPQPLRAHFIRPRRRNPLFRISFFFILGLLSFTIWLIALHVPVHVGAPMVFLYDLMLLALLLIKPQPIFWLRKE